MKMLKITKIIFLICFGLISSIDATDYVFPSPNLSGGNSYLGHYNNGTYQLNNPSTSRSVFLTADQGFGYQAELTPNAAQNLSVGKKNPGIVECQQPFGNPVACTASCKVASVGFTPSGLGTSGLANCTGVINAKVYPFLALEAGITDFLNEKGSKYSTPANYVYLDTIINNSNSAFEIATTTAPLIGTSSIVDPVTKKPVLDPNTIAGALQAGTLTTMNIYGEKPSGSFTVGKVTYPVNFISDSPSLADNRYVIAGANKHNPTTDTLAIKRHMADKNLAFDVLPSTNIPAPKGNQTIILFPNKMESTCQPVIFIGRDKDSNEFYALTYLGAYDSTGNSTLLSHLSMYALTRSKKMLPAHCVQPIHCILTPTLLTYCQRQPPIAILMIPITSKLDIQEDWLSQ